MPIRTSYKFIERIPWSWDEWLTMPLRIKDLPRNSQLAVTVWDIESPQQGDVPVCGATISLFDRYGEFRQGWKLLTSVFVTLFDLIFKTNI